MLLDFGRVLHFAGDLRILRVVKYLGEYRVLLLLTALVPGLATSWHRAIPSFSIKRRCLMTLASERNPSLLESPHSSPHNELAMGKDLLGDMDLFATALVAEELPEALSGSCAGSFFCGGSFSTAGSCGSSISSSSSFSSATG